MMKFTETALSGCFVIEVDRREDQRGWFSRTYCDEEFHKIGFSGTWVQHNHSFTAKRGSIRGMHFQKMPVGEIKLIRCVSGKVFDVAVDLRPHSPTFLKWHAEELSAENGKMFFIPKGFAHGFQTLTDHAELIYCHSERYQPGYEGGINHNDERLKISWPLPVTEISDRDRHHPIIDNKFEGVNSK